MASSEIGSCKENKIVQRRRLLITIDMVQLESGRALWPNVWLPTGICLPGCEGLCISADLTGRFNKTATRAILLTSKPVGEDRSATEAR